MIDRIIYYFLLLFIIDYNNNTTIIYIIEDVKICKGSQGIEEDQINLAVYILKSHGYTTDSFEAEFNYIDWNDYSDFPIRIKQRLKMFLSLSS